MFYVSVKDNYVIAIAKSAIEIGADEITEAEYKAILGIIRNKPSAESGYDYRLKDTLEWELYELPIIPPEDDELSAEEALDIITGGYAE